MTDILQRMISRTQVPLSPVQPILPSVFASAPSVPEIQSEIVVSNPGGESGPTMPAEREAQHDRLHGKRVGQESITHRAVRGEHKPGDSHREASSVPDHTAKELFPQSSAKPEAAHAKSELGGTVQPYVTLVPTKIAETPSLQIPVRSIRAEESASQPHSFQTLAAMRPAASPVTASRNGQAIFSKVSQPPVLRPAKTEVFISIGHLEVRSAPRVEPAPAPRLRYKVTLQDYLTRRKEDAP